MGPPDTHWGKNSSLQCCMRALKVSIIGCATKGVLASWLLFLAFHWWLIGILADAEHHSMQYGCPLLTVQPGQALDGLSAWCFCSLPMLKVQAACSCSETSDLESAKLQSLLLSGSIICSCKREPCSPSAVAFA